MSTGHAVLWAVLVLGLPQVQPATPPPPTGLILGRVVDGSSGRPIGGAIVTLNNGPRAITNASGQFVFRKLAKGAYALQTTRAGYADGAYGRRRPEGSSVSLQIDDGQRVGDLVIPMWKYGAISGNVVDEAGEPLIGVQVRAFQRRLVSGRRRVLDGPASLTDDRGFYRIPNLAPGEYLVAFVWREASVPMEVWDLRRSLPPGDPRGLQVGRESAVIGLMWSPGSPQSMTMGSQLRELEGNAPAPPTGAGQAAIYIYPTQFYPGVANAARATGVTLASGQERENIDFALRPARASRLSGTLLGPDGPGAFTGLRLVPAGDESMTELETSVTMTGNGGEFTFLGVPAGQYTIKALRVPRAPATAPIPDQPTIYAEAAVAVADRDVTDLVVTLQRGARVTGRFEFDGAADRPDTAALMRIGVTLDRVDAAPANSPAAPFMAVPPGRADDTGAFKTYGVPSGRYIVRVGGAPSGWTLKSVMSGGRDLSEQPFELRATDLADVVINFTDRPTRLTGVVRGNDGNPDPAALVVVFPADSTAWTSYGVAPRRMRSTRPTKTGAFTFTALAPGEYYVAAIHEDAIGEWQDPAVLEALSRRSTQIRLVEGEPRAQDVKTVDRGGR